MKEIYIILDYKNRFETKFTAVPYRSGFNLDLLRSNFSKYGYEVKYLHFSEVDFRDNSLKNKIFLYCSSEDKNSFYKSYIEDLIIGLELAGARVIPPYKYLKAHNNKLFMEILRDLSSVEQIKNVKSDYYGTIEDLKKVTKKYGKDRFVFKSSEGSMSRGVIPINNMNNIPHTIKKINRTKNIYQEFRDFYRKFKYQGYIKDSYYRKKFIVQNYIENLPGDWKILIYSHKYYVLKRRNRENDFRASGSGRLAYDTDPPNSLLDYSRKIFLSFNVPIISLDIGYDGNDYYLLEFQFLHFGTYTLEYSNCYFTLIGKKWHMTEKKSILEQEYAKSVSEFLKDNI